ncbi:uncharacterized protein LY79DRAFT_695282 [Colletotrichum navitas]|uniref:Uncharacterized protein n=1 Tax=Colletotrichum navitas TaxID=681940 RepID=A0AAD8V1M9_9PEZI|nr:uncharacterized protein LY79DRAFT_695282 [Colletotrichum navitas]KAK1574500.1 hypothetical protein LY79DRAFT_695282 [Colletotrichum navitas]
MKSLKERSQGFASKTGLKQGPQAHRHLQPAFTKLATLHSKNNFSFAIVTGNLFDVDDKSAIDTLLNGELKALPLNLHFLSKRSITKTSEGIRIVALSRKLDVEIIGGQLKEQHLPYHTAYDTMSLKGTSKAVWLAGVWDRSKIALSPENQGAIESTAKIAELCVTLKPCSNFSSSPAEFFLQANSAKAKALYAFSPTSNETNVERPAANATYTPFKARKQKKSSQDEGSYSRFATGDDDGCHNCCTSAAVSNPPLVGRIVASSA